MEQKKNYSPFKLVKVLNVFTPNERGFVEIEYDTKYHSGFVFRGFVRPTALDKLGKDLVVGNYYSVISDGEYINYVSEPKVGW